MSSRYEGIAYTVTITEVSLFPQGYAAVLTQQELLDEPSVIMADIGGWTVDLMWRLQWPDDPNTETAIRDKVRSVHITVEASGATLYAKLELDMTADLTIAEFEAFTRQAECQYQDGWGAEFELITIPTSDEPVYFRL